MVRDHPACQAPIWTESRAEDVVENPRDRPTMQDIADKVGVSKALVSLVFRKAPGPSDETRRRVFAAADELGYRVNRTAALMTARRSHLIGVMANIRNSFHAEMVEDIVEAADKAGYEVVLGAVTPTHGESKVIDTLLDFRCEGVVLLGSGINGQRVDRTRRTAAHRRRRAPRLRSNHWTSCGRPMVAASAAVVDHLVGLGHRRHRARIGRIRPDRGGPAQRLSTRDATARLRATRWSSTASSPRTRVSPRRKSLLSTDTADRGGLRQRPHRHRRARRTAPGRRRGARAGLGDRLRRQPARPTRSHRSDLGEPGTARAGQPCRRGGGRAAGRRPDHTGVRGAGATVGGTRDDSASTLTVSWNPTISADPAAPQRQRRVRAKTRRFRSVRRR